MIKLINIKYNKESGDPEMENRLNTKIVNEKIYTRTNNMMEEDLLEESDELFSPDTGDVKTKVKLENYEQFGKDIDELVYELFGNNEEIKVKYLKTKNRFRITVKRLKLNFLIDMLDITYISVIFEHIRDVLLVKDGEEPVLNYYKDNHTVNRFEVIMGEYLDSIIFVTYEDRVNSSNTEQDVKESKQITVFPLTDSFNLQTAVRNKSLFVDIKDLHKEWVNKFGRVAFKLFENNAPHLAMVLEVIKLFPDVVDLESTDYVRIASGVPLDRSRRPDIEIVRQLFYNLDIYNFAFFRNIYEIVYQEHELSFHKDKDGHPVDQQTVKSANDLIEMKVKTVKGFEDVFGLKTIKDKLKIIGDGLKYNYNNRDNTIDLPKGILLIGPPGTGKTLVTAAFIKEYNFTAVEMAGYVGKDGVDGVAIKNAFRAAKNSSDFAPTVLFIDELDKIFTSVNEQLMTVLLDELSQPTNFIVMAAANSQQFHPALIRPGRFDVKLHFGKLSFDSKVEIFRDVLKARKINPDYIDPFLVIEYLPANTTVAYLDAIAKQAKLIETLEKRELDTSDIISISDDIMQGISETVPFDAEGRRRVAYHEAGHAVMALVGNMKITTATIKRGHEYGGYVMLRVKEDMFLDYDFVEQNIYTSLGGWASEKLVFKDFSTGAFSDFASVERDLEFLIAVSGDSGSNLIALDPRANTNRSLEQSSDFYKVKKKRMKKYIKSTQKTIKQHKDLLVAIASELINKETLSGDEIDKIYEQYKKKKGIK